MTKSANWPLYALGLKWEVRTYKERKARKFRETQCTVWGKKSRRGAYYEYGDSAMKTERRAIEKHGAFVRIPYSDMPDGDSLIGGIFFYTGGNKPLRAGYAKTGAYVGGNRKLDDVFRVEGFQGFSETNASKPTVQLQSIMVVLAVTEYRKWNFRAMDVSRSFSTEAPLKRDTYDSLPTW